MDMEEFDIFTLKEIESLKSKMSSTVGVFSAFHVVYMFHSPLTSTVHVYTELADYNQHISGTAFLYFLRETLNQVYSFINSWLDLIHISWPSSGPLLIPGLNLKWFNIRK